MVCDKAFFQALMALDIVDGLLTPIVSYSNEKTKRAEILKIKVLLITQLL
jgi:hypothetical protein